MTDRSKRYVVLIFQLNGSSNYVRSVYASAPFKFIVNGEPLYIHADLVSLHSKPLDRMIHCPMAEAQKGFANLEDVDEGTFVRFIEWAHKGYYTAADFETVDTESPSSSQGQSPDVVIPAKEEAFSFGQIVEDEVPLEPTPDFNQWGTSFGSNRKGKKGKKAGTWGTSIHESMITPAQDERKELKEAFISRKYTVRQSVIQVPPPRPNQSPSEDYTDVFLSHAQLYVFAEKYDIQKLKASALEELHATLAIYTQYSERTGDIIALLRYVYDNTAETKEGSEDMRNLMTEYVGYEMDALMDDEDFKNLMIEDGGSLLGDFMTMVRRRIS